MQEVVLNLLFFFRFLELSVSDSLTYLVYAGFLPFMILTLLSLRFALGFRVGLKSEVVAVAHKELTNSDCFQL